jgi:complex iron-sulfur molybdoenzyme family reductase subunit gamma
MSSFAIALVLPLLTSASSGSERFLAAESIPVASTATLPATTTDPAWSALPTTSVPLSPQLAVTLNDKAANAQRTQTPKEARLRAAASQTHLALLLEWDDQTETRFSGDSTSSGDAAAVQMPASFGPGKRLPYIGMGDADSHVVVHMVRAQGEKPSQVARRHAVAAGFGSLTPAPMPWMKTALSYDRTQKTWRAMFVRPIVVAEHSVDAGLVPVAVAVWDGDKQQRGGNKALSGWRYLRLPARALNDAYVAELAWGYGDGEGGNAVAGQQMAQAICLSCHRINGQGYGAPDAAPDLSSVGVVSSYGYLRDSIINPSLVLVPNLNPNRHQARGAPRDPHGAYMNAPLGTFAVTGPDGKPQSTMPSFAAMPLPQVQDLVAYLKTLGVPPSQSASLSSPASPTPPTSPSPSSTIASTHAPEQP